MTTTKPNANYRRDKIPLWINVLSGLVALILLFQSISAYLAPHLAYGAFDMSTVANRHVMAVLGGRNVTMCFVTIMAIRSQNAMFLAYTFLMHFAREAQDMFIVPYYAGPTTPAGIGQFVVFLCVFVIPYGFALKTLRKLAAMPDDDPRS